PTSNRSPALLACETYATELKGMKPLGKGTHVGGADPMDSPGGRPVADQLSGATPPLAVTVNEYGVPTVPLGRAVVVMTKGLRITSRNFADAVCSELSLTETGTVNVPMAVGVPLIAPVVVFNCSPEGSVADHTSGGFPPAAVRVK